MHERPYAWHNDTSLKCKSIMLISIVVIALIVAQIFVIIEIEESHYIILSSLICFNILVSLVIIRYMLGLIVFPYSHGIVKSQIQRSMNDNYSKGLATLVKKVDKAIQSYVMKDTYTVIEYREYIEAVADMN